MSRMSGARLWGATALAGTLALAACGSSGTKAATTATGPQKVAVTLTDSGCTPATLTVDAGAVTFDITNSSSSRSEFEVLTAKPSIVGETEGGEGGVVAGDPVRSEMRAASRSARWGQLSVPRTARGACPWRAERRRIWS